MLAVSVPEKDDIALILPCKYLEAFKGTLDAVPMAMGSEDLMIQSGQYKKVITQTVIVAVTCNMYDLLRERGMG